MSMVSADCAILTAWQPTKYVNGCCVPSEYCNSAGNVVRVNLDSNQLTGPIPTELGRLTSLQVLYLHNNQLTGTIPTELGMLTSLAVLLLESNQLTGTIPTELGRLTRLTVLRLDSNRLSGSIPCEFGNLKALSTSNFTGNPLQSTSFNAASCKRAPTTSLSTTFTTVTSTSINASPSIICNDSTCEQKSIAPIVGGVVGAALLLAIGLGIWYRQKRSKNQRGHATDDMQSTIRASDESIGQFPSSSSPPASDSLLPSDKKVAVPTTTLNKFPMPEKVSLFNHLERLPQERKFENLRSLKATLSEIKTPTVPKSVTVSEGSSKMFSQPAASDFTSKALTESLTESSSHQMALPDNPRDWNQDETAQWMLERFGDAKLSSLALSQNINGRALLMLERQDMTSALELETVGRRVLFEEAVAELRRQSAQQSALAQENPPSYE